MRRFFITIVLCCFSILAYGDNDKKVKNIFKLDKPKLEEQSSALDSLNAVIDSLKNSLYLKDSLLILAQNEPDTIFVHGNDSLLIQEQADSLMTLNRVLLRKDSLIIALYADLAAADTCMITLAYQRCKEKFHKNNIEKAISYFDKLYTAQLKSDREKDLLPLLKDYEIMYTEIITILTIAQNDPDRLDNPFVEVDYRNKYISLLKKSTYYTKYYNADFQIKYLNNLIDESIEILKRHTAADAADFTKFL